MAILREVPIEMRDDNVIVDEMNKLVDQLDLARQVVNGSVDKFTLLINNLENDVDYAQGVIRNFNKNFCKYLLEALVRNLNVIPSIQKYQKLIGRDKKISRSLLQIAGLE